MKVATSVLDVLQEKFATTRRELAAALIERDDEIDVVLTALIANEHALFVGNPGTGKSLLLDSLLAWTGGRRFSILLTKFSVPEEVCGAISLAALKEDRFIRITTGKLPEADYAFIDEIFKASSAILRSVTSIVTPTILSFSASPSPAADTCAWPRSSSQMVRPSSARRMRYWLK